MSRKKSRKPNPKKYTKHQRQRLEELIAAIEEDTFAQVGHDNLTPLGSAL